MKKSSLFLLAILAVAVASMPGCGGGNAGGDEDNEDQTNNWGPWIGNWIQVNFLGDDDNDVWDQDDPTGIGFVAKITENEWFETDDYGDGCTVTYSYSVDTNNRYSKHATSVTDNCPFPLSGFLDESGTLEFSEGNRFMFDYFDLEPGNTLVAFKWMRESACDFSSQPGEPERCFGGVGKRCDGDAIGAPFTVNEDTCYVDGFMSVGSILHDRCCLETNNIGYSCSGLNQGDPNLCMEEWEEAWYNTQCSILGYPRQWEYRFGPYPVGNSGDDTSQDLRAPQGTRVNPNYQNICETAKCRVDTGGDPIIEFDGCGNYCVCE